MARPKEREEIGVRANFRVKLDPHHLHVVRGSGAHQLVIRIRHVTLRIPNLSLHHSSHSLKRKLHTPETPGSELSKLVTRVVRSIRIQVQSWVFVVVVSCGGHFLQMKKNTLYLWFDKRERLIIESVYNLSGRDYI